MMNGVIKFSNAIDFDSDDFTTISLIARVETGERVDNDEFSIFLDKSKELIAVLQKMTGG